MEKSIITVEDDLVVNVEKGKNNYFTVDIKTLDGKPFIFRFDEKAILKIGVKQNDLEDKAISIIGDVNKLGHVTFKVSDKYTEVLGSGTHLAEMHVYFIDNLIYDVATSFSRVLEIKEGKYVINRGKMHAEKSNLNLAYKVVDELYTDEDIDMESPIVITTLQALDALTETEDGLSINISKIIKAENTYSSVGIYPHDKYLEINVE